MPNKLTHEQADKEIEAALAPPTSSAMGAFQKFLSNRGATGLPQPTNMPRLPKEAIKKLPLKIQ